MFYGIIELEELLFSLMKQNDIKQTKNENCWLKKFPLHHGITFKALATFDTIFVHLMWVKLSEINSSSYMGMERFIIDLNC